MKAAYWVVLLYWLTGISTRPILACDQHPPGQHAQWAAMVARLNAEGEKLTAAENAAAAAKKAAADATPRAPRARATQR